MLQDCKKLGDEQASEHWFNGEESEAIPTSCKENFDPSNSRGGEGFFDAPVNLERQGHPYESPPSGSKRQSKCSFTQQYLRPTSYGPNLLLFITDVMNYSPFWFAYLLDVTR